MSGHSVPRSPDAGRGDGVQQGTADRPALVDTRTLVQVVGPRGELVEDGPWDETASSSQLAVIAAGAPDGAERNFAAALRGALG